MKEYRLTVNPRILELLGPNLYTNIYYVLAELIANAYDADAKNVYIISNKDDIRVEDDGHGMSYGGGDIERYLNVAGVSRLKESESLTRLGTRRKMGRKGVGKLAALSVSRDVDILTVAEGEKSGFVLSRQPEEGNLLKPIEDSDVNFVYVVDHGSAVVMRNPQYRLHKTLSVVKKNILKIFPLISSDFRVHIIREKDVVVVDNYDKSIMSELSVLITFGEEFSNLSKLVPDENIPKRSELVDTRSIKEIPIVMKDNDGSEHEYTLKIAGWIGAYKTTRGRKAEMIDFPDNFISLFANKKMGEFNILPLVGQNKLSEVFIVGQLHVDLFELTELPDMALSNRQGYKSDDPRYMAVLEYVRKDLVIDVLKRRDTYVDLSKTKKKNKQEKYQREVEAKLKKSVEEFKQKASKEAAESIVGLNSDLSCDAVQNLVFQSINKNSPDLGLKQTADKNKKKILISQTRRDKPFADIVYQMLLYNNISSEDILYTNCDDEVCRVPEGRRVYEYLRDFFVDSYSAQKILVLFVTSQNTKESWGAITEVGAAWITQVDHKIFNIHPFRPEHPLDDEMQWQSTNREYPKEGDLWMVPMDADVFCQKIESVCDILKHDKKSRSENKEYLGTLVSIRSI